MNLGKVKSTEMLLQEIEELKIQLFEANSIIEAIKEGSIDALVLNKGGKPNIYSLESADYTYRILIEKFGEGALSISEEGLILYCNDYFAKLINLPCDRIVGTYINSYVDSAGQFHSLKNELKNGPSKGEITLNVNGKKVPIYLSLTSLKPKLDAIGIVVTDLTQKRKHEEALALYQQELELKVNELRQININLEQFVHVISHDIKEPLRKIAAYSSQFDTLKPDTMNTDDLHKLYIINNSAIRLNLLIDNLPKQTFSTASLEMQKVNLNKIVMEVIEDLELLIKENLILIKTQFLPSVIGEQIQLRQLFSNLLINIIQFRKKKDGFHITISSEIADCVDVHFPNKKFHKISLNDNETQFPIQAAENEQHLIGLSICSTIMENHGGKIDVNKSYSGDNTFNLYFPVN